MVTQGLCVLELTDGGTRHLVDVPEADCLRANDAAVDPAGRLWIGTMSLPGRAGAPGGLWRWEPGDARRCASSTTSRWPTGIGVEPGRGPDVLRRLAAPARSTPSPTTSGPGRSARPSRSSRCRAEDGLPDGLAVAADGSVWVALAGGGAVHRYAAGRARCPTGRAAGAVPDQLRLRRRRR